MSSDDTPVNSAAGSPPHEPWKRELAFAIRDPFELCRLLDLPRRVAEESVEAAGSFPLLVPRGFAARMTKGDPADPLLRQVLPTSREREVVEGFTADPLAERSSLAAAGLVRKYAGRALVLATGGCAVNCRYCFRREFPYAESGATRQGVVAAVDEIAASDDLHEVILSGGDPLLLDDDLLSELVGRLEDIPHVRRLRIHTRLPVVLPERVTERLVERLSESRLRSVVVIHANHAAELDRSVAEAMSRLAASGAILLNQAVLLAGVNDRFETLRDLSDRLLDLGVVPYYLHLLDRVVGAASFEVPESRAVALHRRMRDELPGYAVPRLAREVPGEPAKVWLG